MLKLLHPGHTCLKFGAVRPESSKPGRLRPNLARMWPILARGWPTLAMSGRPLGMCRYMVASLARNCGQFVATVLIPTKFAQHQSTPGQSWKTPGQIWPQRVRPHVGQMLVEVGPNRPNSATCWPDSTNLTWAESRLPKHFFDYCGISGNFGAISELAGLPVSLSRSQAVSSRISQTLPLRL